jgi:hypothetical protein
MAEGEETETGCFAVDSRQGRPLHRRERNNMKCSICGREKPEDPCAVVEATKNAQGRVTATIKLDGVHPVTVGGFPYEEVEGWAHRFADDKRCNLHWHWTGEDKCVNAKLLEALRTIVARIDSCHLCVNSAVLGGDAFRVRDEVAVELQAAKDAIKLAESK